MVPPESAKSARLFHQGAQVPDTQRLLELALKGLEAEREKLDGEIREIKA
jgi:hypothetical protein